MTNQITKRLGQRVLSSQRFRESAKLHRQTAGTRDNFGEFVPGTATVIDVQVVSAPITGRERLVLPEGLRERDVRKFWLREPVVAVLEGSDGHQGDQIEYDGDIWQAKIAHDWGGFVEAVTVRQGAAP